MSTVLHVNKQPKKKRNKSIFKAVSAWLHLWLGLVSGAIMVIVCLTGCIWMFNVEITDALHPERRVERQNAPLKKPAELAAIVRTVIPKGEISGMEYKQGRATVVYVGGRRNSKTVYMNPYSGQIIGDPLAKKSNFDFFRWVLMGHRFLWLPFKIGRPIINYATLTFTVILLTGLVLWWPKRWNKANRDKSFKIKTDGSRKRLNYDLHNVLGFYSMLILLMVAITGMVFGLSWFSKGLYWATTGGDTMPERGRNALSDTVQTARPYTPMQAVDVAFTKAAAAVPDAQGFYLNIPGKRDAAEPIYVYVYPSKEKFYNSKSFVFDRYTVDKLKGDKLMETDFSELKAGQQLKRLNYDLHVGTAFGLTGKVLIFLATLIGGSLPITGLIVWLNRKKKSKKAPAKKAVAPKRPAGTAPVRVGIKPKPAFANSTAVKRPE